MNQLLVPILMALASAVAPAARAAPVPPPSSGAAVAVSWTASPVMVSCDGPVEAGVAWYDVGFRPADWAPVTMPDAGPIPGNQPGDRFYRGTFHTSGDEALLLEVMADDGVRIFLNGHAVAREGADCHRAGCVNTRCGNGVAAGGLHDLTPLVRPGENLLAVHLTNGGCCGSHFDARLLRGVRMVQVDWFASPVTADCEGPRDVGGPWYGDAFSVRGWSPVRMPDLMPIPWTDAADRFYRGYFLTQPGARYVVRLHSDDGCELYANGRFVTRQGGLCHAGGTAKGSLELSPWMTPGVNLLAAHLSNAPVAGGSLMSVVVLEVVPVPGVDSEAFVKELFVGG